MADPVLPTCMEQQEQVAVSTSIFGSYIPADHRPHWYDTVWHVLEDIKNSMCEKCQGIHFERALEPPSPDPRWLDWLRLGYRDHENALNLRNEQSCGLCACLRTHQVSLVLIIPPPPNAASQSQNLKTPLVVLEIESFHTEIYAKGILTSSDYIWSADPEAIDYASLRRQLTHCEKLHVECQQEPHCQMEKLSVIDCHTRQIMRAPPQCAYVALSYVWGPAPATYLSQGGFLPSPLDATIEDAILVTLRLGFKYIWVDRYCISEEANDEELRRAQIKNMHLVYSNAQVTIIAAAGNDVTFGLPGVQQRPRSSRAFVPLGSTFLSFPLSSSERLLNLSQWMTRGWTLQEATFSRRRLIFTEERLFLQCHQTESADDYLGRCRRYTTPAAQRANLLSGWKPSISFGAHDGIEGLVKAIHQYCQRDLTYDHDALRGFQGILSAYENRGILNHWGIPVLNLHLNFSVDEDAKRKRDSIDGLVYGLCWSTRGPCKRRSQFPTWSWAGWKGVTWYEWFDDEELSMTGTDVEVEIELKSGERISWNDYDQASRIATLPATITPYIWITAWSSPLTFETSSRGRYFVTGITLRGDKISWIAIGLKDDSIFAEAKEGSISGILVASREKTLEDCDFAFVMIVEHKLDCAERIGYVDLNFSMTMMSSGSPKSDKHIGNLLPWKRQSIRLG